MQDGSLLSVVCGATLAQREVLFCAYGQLLDKGLEAHYINCKSRQRKKL